MYTWGFINADVRAAADGLPQEAVLALLGFMPAVCLNLPDGEPGAGLGGWRMPTMAFGARNEGMVSFLVVEDEKELLITQIAWLG